MEEYEEVKSSDKTLIFWGLFMDILEGELEKKIGKNKLEGIEVEMDSKT